MKVSCSNCNSSYVIDDSKIPEKGATAVCKKCNNKIIIKKDLPELELQEIVTHDENKPDKKIDNEMQSPVVDKDGKRCPYCAEFIHSEASKCKHCGSILKNDDTSKSFINKLIVRVNSVPFPFIKTLLNDYRNDMPDIVKAALKLLYFTLCIGIISSIIQSQKMAVQTRSSFVFVVFTSILIIAFIGFFIYMMGKRHNWARIVFLVLFIGGSIIYVFNFINSPSLDIFSIAQTVLQVIAIVLLFKRESSVWFTKVKI